MRTELSNVFSVGNPTNIFNLNGRDGTSSREN